MMPRVFAAARVLAALVLLVSWTTAGWAADCARRDEAAPETAMHAMMHHGAHQAMHHPSPPRAPHHPRGGDRPECPLLAMNGGSCLGAAQAPAAFSASSPSLASADAYPSADGVLDSLLPFSFFHPPRT
jgi:hypothetical protein